MIKRFLLAGLIIASSLQGTALYAHCQMPCGIYHDDMVYDQIDQYIETMAKGITVLTDNKFSTVQERNEFMRWVLEKEQSSDEVAALITKFFLQQKIKPNEGETTTKRVMAAHKLLFLLVPIKQTVDLKFLNDFYEEWENFKLMFHVEGYECKMEQIKLKKWAEKRKAQEEADKKAGKVDTSKEKEHSHDDDHDHDHDHDHSH